MSSLEIALRDSYTSEKSKNDNGNLWNRL